MGDWNSEASEVNTCMETQGLTNKICDIHGYSDALITYQQSKDCPSTKLTIHLLLRKTEGGSYPLKD